MMSRAEPAGASAAEVGELALERHLPRGGDLVDAPQLSHGWTLAGM